jgi:predicted DNA-binding helix-hairpin-helix protein
METIEKLKVLSKDSQYDLACACGTNRDDHRTRGLDGKWLYPVALPQGGYSVLLKTLLSNACANDCRYCPLRSDSNVRRCTLRPEEVARLLRKDHGYRGYIHLKIIPGASDAAIEEALSLSTAVSLNIEAPGRKHFDLLTGRKDFDRDIMRPIKLMGRLTGEGMRFAKIKCTTQFIVGASHETDSEIIHYMSGLYRRLNFKRVYFSAYQQGLGSPDIPGERRNVGNAREPFVREHRLYQVDFLFRRYGFSEKEIPLDGSGNLSLEKDPKQAWADSHPSFYPVRINTADREALLRVPGIGPETVKVLLKARREGRIRCIEDLGVKGKRARTIRRYSMCE